MDYKAQWNQINNATYELQGHKATIDMGEPSQEVTELAAVRAWTTPKPKELLMLEARKREETRGREEEPPKTLELEDKKAENQKPETPEASLGTGEIADNVKAEDIKFVAPFWTSIAGLIQARKICRFRMSKIVMEVDAVARDPRLATDHSRDRYFLHPLVFKQLLPVSLITS